MEIVLTLLLKFLKLEEFSNIIIGKVILMIQPMVGGILAEDGLDFMDIRILGLYLTNLLGLWAIIIILTLRFMNFLVELYPVTLLLMMEEPMEIGIMLDL